MRRPGNADLLGVRKTLIFSNMNTLNNTAGSIRARIARMATGAPFISTDFQDCGTRASVDQTLSRLVKFGMIARVARGVFVRPEISRFVGPVPPEPIKVAEALAKINGAQVQVHGAEAARRLALTTQMPTQAVFNTSGPSRRVRLDGLELRLQHVSPRKLLLAGRPAGLALAALWYLGKDEVTVATIAKIRAQLAPGDFAELQSVASAMPAWMSDALFRATRETVNV